VKHTKEQSPIFAQFLDCVWQVTVQLPTHFEFDGRLLLALLDLVASCRFGNFLHSSERERVEARVWQSTASVWVHVDRHRADFLNPLYAPPPPPPSSSSTPKAAGGDGAAPVLALLPVVGASRLRLWTAFFQRWDPNARPAILVAAPPVAPVALEAAAANTPPPPPPLQRLFAVHAQSLCPAEGTLALRVAELEAKLDAAGKTLLLKSEEEAAAAALSDFEKAPPEREAACEAAVLEASARVQAAEAAVAEAEATAASCVAASRRGVGGSGGVGSSGVDSEGAGVQARCAQVWPHMSGSAHGFAWSTVSSAGAGASADAGGTAWGEAEPGGGGAWLDSDRASLPSSVAWIPDEASNNCNHCFATFTVFNRRHHCRGKRASLAGNASLGVRLLLPSSSLPHRCRLALVFSFLSPPFVLFFHFSFGAGCGKLFCENHSPKRWRRGGGLYGPDAVRTAGQGDGESPGEDWVKERLCDGCFDPLAAPGNDGGSSAHGDGAGSVHGGGSRSDSLSGFRVRSNFKKLMPQGVRRGVKSAFKGTVNAAKRASGLGAPHGAPHKSTQPLGGSNSMASPASQRGAPPPPQASSQASQAPPTPMLAVPLSPGGSRLPSANSLSKGAEWEGNVDDDNTLPGRGIAAGANHLGSRAEDGDDHDDHDDYDDYDDPRDGDLGAASRGAPDGGGGGGWDEDAVSDDDASDDDSDDDDLRAAVLARRRLLVAGAAVGHRATATTPTGPQVPGQLSRLESATRASGAGGVGRRAFLKSCGLERFLPALDDFGFEDLNELLDPRLVTDKDLLGPDIGMTPADVEAFRAAVARATATHDAPHRV